MMASVSMVALLLAATVAALPDTTTELITMAVGDVETLQSPGYPQNYPTNVRMQWEYTCGTEADNQLVFQCSTFDLQPSTNCIWDRLIVTSRGGHRNVKCGSDCPDTFTSTGWMRLTFFSNAIAVRQGFDCSITCMAKLTPISSGTHTLVADQTVIIQSSNFPQPSGIRERSQWEFSCPDKDSHFLQIACPDFDLTSSPACTDERLIVAYVGGRDVKCSTDSPDGTVTSTGWARLTFFSKPSNTSPGFNCGVSCKSKGQETIVP